MNTLTEFHFAAETKRLHNVRARVRRQLIAWGVPETTVQQTVLAVHEACANAIRHGCNNRGAGTVAVHMRHDARMLDIKVCDTGHVPHPDTADAATAKPFQPLASGGLGLRLIRRVFDDVQITTNAKQGTCVHMRRYHNGTRV